MKDMVQRKCRELTFVRLTDLVEEGLLDCTPKLTHVFPTQPTMGAAAAAAAATATFATLSLTLSLSQGWRLMSSVLLVLVVILFLVWQLLTSVVNSLPFA